MAEGVVVVAAVVMGRRGTPTYHGGRGLHTFASSFSTLRVALIARPSSGYKLAADEDEGAFADSEAEAEADPPDSFPSAEELPTPRPRRFLFFALLLFPVAEDFSSLPVALSLPDAYDV